jgi:FkbM family methyltransferase
MEVINQSFPSALSITALVERPISDSNQSLFERLIKTGGGPKYILGRNKYADCVAQVFHIEAFIDDFTSEPTYLGRPVVRMSQLPHDCLVVSCVVDIRPLTALRRLHAFGVEAIDYFSLVRLYPDKFLPVDYCGNNQNDIKEHIDDYQWVYENLADNYSKESFRKIVQFRYTFDLECMSGFSPKIDQQYFEKFLQFGEKEVFVDGGGYDEETTVAFAARALRYQHIYYFEPMLRMMEVSKERLKPLSKIEYFQKGLYNHKGLMQFDGTGGSASRVVETGKDTIEVVKLDDEVREPVTFIKLDIEGAELYAIEGAENQIRSYTPAIAACVYHNQADFWRIPKRILEMNNNYKIYLRHYSEGILETVMFFIPTAHNKSCLQIV